MKSAFVAILLLTLSGCVTTTSHYGKRPDFMSISVGMTQEEVIRAIGKPSKVSATQGQTYLQYGWDDPWDGRVGASEEFCTATARSMPSARRATSTPPKIRRLTSTSASRSSDDLHRG